MRFRLVHLVAPTALSCAFGLWSLNAAWHRRSELASARQESARGGNEAAYRRLTALVARHPNDPEILYEFGRNAAETGHDDEARAAWDQIPPSSEFGARAALQLARQVLRHHRFAEAETYMSRVLQEPGAAGLEASETLVNLFKIQGRFEEARRLVRATWDRYPDKIGLLRESAQLGSPNPYKLDRVRSGLDVAYQAAADDDRIWLGWANFAIRTGRFDDAHQWLDRCEQKRPDDAAVLRAVYQLAQAEGDVATAERAVRRLPPAAIDPAEALALRAWFADKAGAAGRERQALADLVELETDNLRAIEQLAELEWNAGRADDSERLRARKAELTRAKAEYEILLFLPDAAERTTRLARLAESLGRHREARTLWGLGLIRRPRDTEASDGLERAKKQTPVVIPERATLAAVLEDLRMEQKAEVVAVAAGPTGARPFFQDLAESTGLRFTFRNGESPLRHLPETMSGGLALLDFDGDGWLDVYCVQGGVFPPAPADARCEDRLFRNRGDGTFDDVSGSSGIAAMPGGYGHGVTVGDYDNDGRPDLFVTRWRSYALYHNRGDGTFEDATESVGLAGPRDWPTSAAFADLDNDGDLDLYVCHYLDWDSDKPQPCWDPKKNRYVYCGPPRFRSLPDHVFRNDAGRFVEVTTEAGFVDPHGQGLGVLAADIDDDGRIDLFVANDQSANYLFRNLGDFRFHEAAEISGVASSAEGHYQASMGLALGDPDGDGRPDLAKTNFYNQGTTLYHNMGQGLFSDHSAEVGLLVPTRYVLGFGVSFLDANADGLPDLATANGHVDDFRPEEPYAMPTQFLLGLAGGRFQDATDRSGPPWAVPRIGRGLAVGDLDNDGRPDVVVLSQNSPVAYLHNETDGGRWLILELVGTRSNRDAIGAKVTIRSGGRSQTAWRFGGGSYQSASDRKLHFGLGDAATVESIDIVWPSGQVDHLGPVAPNQAYRLREGSARADPLPGY